jgi:hypothetical protein
MKFIPTLTAEYVRLFQTPEYAMAAARYSPEFMAVKMARGLLTGAASKDGEGIRNTCKALGIKHTYKAIHAHFAALPTYAAHVASLEAEGLTTSDAQGVTDLAVARGEVQP